MKPPALTMAEAKALLDWMTGTPYPKDAEPYVTVREALKKLHVMTDPRWTTQEKKA